MSRQRLLASAWEALRRNEERQQLPDDDESCVSQDTKDIEEDQENLARRVVKDGKLVNRALALALRTNHKKFLLAASVPINGGTFCICDTCCEKWDATEPELCDCRSCQSKNKCELTQELSNYSELFKWGYEHIDDSYGSKIVQNLLCNKKTDTPCVRTPRKLDIHVHCHNY